jgi:hypothetical protein
VIYQHFRTSKKERRVYSNEVFSLGFIAITTYLRSFSQHILHILYHLKRAMNLFLACLTAICSPLFCSLTTTTTTSSKEQTPYLKSTFPFVSTADGDKHRIQPLNNELKFHCLFSKSDYIQGILFIYFMSEGERERKPEMNCSRTYYVESSIAQDVFIKMLLF